MTAGELEARMPQRELRERMLLDRRRVREAEQAAERARFLAQHKGRR